MSSSSPKRMSAESQKEYLAAAIDYIQHLERSVQCLRDEVCKAQEQTDEDLNDDASSLTTSCVSGLESSDNINSIVLQLEVSRDDSSSMYAFHIVCKSEQQALERLVRAFEELDVEVQQANITTRNEQISSYYLVKAPRWSRLSLDDVKEEFLSTMSRIGVPL
ncbi:hypothetical protein SELMODRAFT_449332 [Selaginella moellendorffii]|uniref:BHLH domain-containing protein n=1 Tax=Selaginella moellendorffii TaxID=88036 RepID=D8TF42_SELML|nr:hypothetical protein SELMODRAFT_449332 [Selaginella moellendorffii]